MALTREEAVERARLLQVTSYDVALDLTGGDEGAATFGSATRVVFGCREPGGSTFAEFRSPEPVEAVLNGRPVQVEDGRILLLDLEDDNELVVRGRGAYSTSGEGMHRAVDPADGAVYVYGMCFLAEASRIFACFDQPDLKAVMRLTVTAPQGWKVLSNSPESSGSPGVFEPTPPLPTYLLAVAAGPYAEAHDVWRPDNHREVPLSLYCRRSLAPHLEADDLFALTKAGLAFFTESFDVPLPFAKYDQLFAPDFNAGAMETPGLVMHRDELLFRSVVTDAERETRAEILLHEMAHMWFGDLVTMRWWDDLWLNEAFASYCGYLATAEATRYRDAWTTFCVNEKSSARKADAWPSSHPVASSAADTDAALLNFDAISYAKGASLLRQLAAFVGRDAFFTGVSTYFGRHAWGNTELTDLLAALERPSGRDLTRWGEDHLRTVGAARMRPEVTVDASTGRISGVDLLQDGAHGGQRVGVGVYAQDGDRLVRTHHAEIDVTGARTPVPALAGAAPGVVLVNDGDLAYASVGFDDESLALLRRTGVSAFAESLPRALAWGALWDMARAAELSAETFVDLVAGATAGEPDVSVLTRVTQRAEDVAVRLAPADRVAGLRARMSDACEQAAAAAEPGSGRQLALVRAQVTSAVTGRQLDVVEALLDGAWELPDLAVDADLRWHLLTRLVAVGRRGADAVDAEQAHDATAFGRHRAETARAALPDVTAKEAAWAVATGRAGEVNNRRVESACRGFWQPDQLTVSRPFARRYFDEVEHVWRDNDTEIALTVAWLLFPSRVVEPGTLELADRFLERGELPAGLRRIVADQRYELALALAARESAETAEG